MISRQSAIAALGALALAGCAHEPECGAGTAMVETQLFFGMNMPNGGQVTASAWEEFLRVTLAPRFPEGFTVIDSSGFWRDVKTHRTIREPGKLVVRLHKGSVLDEKATAETVEAYKARFAQESVLRADRPVCARF